MENSDIVRALEAFVNWSDDDKQRVMRALSFRAIMNLLRTLPYSNDYNRWINDSREWGSSGSTWEDI